MRVEMTEVRCHPDAWGVVHLVFPQVHSKISVCSTFGDMVFVELGQKASAPTCLHCIDKAFTFMNVVYLE
jgi:hypothetical protein